MSVSPQTLSLPALKQLSRREKLELLVRCRESSARHSEAVLFLAADLLSQGSGGVSAVELYNVYEQAVIAALDCGKGPTARQYLDVLIKKFGSNSLRVSHLQGLCLEAEGKSLDAEKLYAELLKRSPTDDFPIQRLAAMRKCSGRLREAIDILESKQVYTDEDDEPHTFLEVHRGDSRSTLLELSNLYYQLGNLDKAIYYSEELVLFSGEKYTLHTRLGELHFAAHDYAKSLSAYAQSLRLNGSPNNARAAYGLWVTANEVLKLHSSGTKKAGEADRKCTTELRAWAADRLRRMYAGSPMLSVLEALVERAA